MTAFSIAAESTSVGAGRVPVCIRAGVWSLPVTASTPRTPLASPAPLKNHQAKLTKFVSDRRIRAPYEAARRSLQHVSQPFETCIQAHNTLFSEGFVCLCDLLARNLTINLREPETVLYSNRR